MVQNEITVSLHVIIAIRLPSSSAYEIIYCEALQSAILTTAWLLVIN